MLEMQVWDGLSKARLHLDSFEAPRDDLEDLGMAFMTENTNLQQALLLRLQELAFGRKFELLAPTKVASIERDAADRGSWPILKTDSGREIRARLLVGADGPNSPVRKYANIDTHGWMYDEHGVVATMELETFSDNRTAWQRFLPSGPVAFLPMPDDKATLVWSTRPAVAAAVKKLRPETFAALVNAAFRLPFDSISFLYDRLLDPSTTEEQLLDDISWRSSYDVVGPEGTPSVFSNDLPPEVLAIQPGSVASFPFRYAHANSYIGEPPLGETLPSRTVLVGDAAHSMHPLAGQGLNTGLGDAESLANALESALHVGEDPGSVLALRGYTRDRYLANHLLMSGVDKLHKLYGTEAGLVVWARSMGLEVVNESSTLRSFFMNQAGSLAQSARRSSPLMSGLAHAVQLGTAATQLLSQTAGAVANHWLASRQGR